MFNIAEIPYVYTKDGYYYFNRRVPMDLQGHFRRKFLEIFPQ